MRKGDTYTAVFAFGVCVVCSLLLSGSAALLRAPQERNRLLDQRRNVLKAMGVDSTRQPAEEVNRIYETHIEEIRIDPESGERIDEEGLRLLLWREDGDVTRYALPVSGKGLWSTISGFLALEADTETIAGITFYEHGETPGLGGEIEKPWFQEQFQGKKVWMNDNPVTLRVLKSGAEGRPDAVDGISGATMTGRGIETFLNENIRRYDAFFKAIREQS